MKSQLHEVVGADEIVVSNGNGNGNGSNGGALATVETATTLERMAFAEGSQRPSEELLERYESILDAYAKKVQDRIELNVKKAIALAKQGPQAGIELAEPINVGPPLYKWWDVFVVGPIQNITLPPFLPHKIIADNERAFFLAFVVKNPLPMFGGPSALTVMNGRRFNLNAHFCNLTTCSAGPRIRIRSRFNTSVVQPFLLVFNPPTAQQGRPDLYEVNITVDVTEFQQPMAGFATRILDIDTDPDGLPFPLDAAKGPHVHDEQPMRFLVYRP